MLLTHRGKPVARLEPIAGEAIDADDPFYSLCELAAPGESLSSSQIERILYSKQ